MKINFTKKQYENLMKLVYLGNWMVNAHRTNDTIGKYEEIESYIFSFAKDFGLKKYVDDKIVDDGKFYPTRFFEEETDVDKLHDEYDNEIFWEELAERLGERDFCRIHGKEKIEKMSREERFEKLYKCIDKWNDELYKNGIRRIEIIKDKDRA